MLENMAVEWMADSDCSLRAYNAEQEDLLSSTR